ncbi:HEAT repeat domain-containing protein [Erwinia rhapontici]
MSMSPPIANLLARHLNSPSKDVKLATIYALGEARCTAGPIVEFLEEFINGDDQELKIAAIKAFGRIYR